MLKNFINDSLLYTVIKIQLQKQQNFNGRNNTLLNFNLKTSTDLPWGVQNKFKRIILSSLTPCSFKTLTDLITVFPVPIKYAH